MIVLDVNPLVYAFRPDSTDHEAHRRILLTILDGPDPCGAPDLVLSSVLRLCTNARIYREPSPMAEVIAFVEAVRNAAGYRPLVATDAQWRVFLSLCAGPGVGGNHVPDAFIASFALVYDADLLTSDAAMSRFPGVRVRNPLR